MIHRDLKPLNVMVGAFGEVQVMDWGLAKVLDRKDDPEALQTQPQVSVIRTERSETGSNPTVYGDLMGTAAYMPPEQARGEIDRLDERTDVFALGSILCKILTGDPAYRGRTHHEIIDRAKVADLADARARLDACGCEPGPDRDRDGLPRADRRGPPARCLRGRATDDGLPRGGPGATCVPRRSPAPRPTARAEAEEARAEAEKQSSRERASTSADDAGPGGGLRPDGGRALLWDSGEASPGSGGRPREPGRRP